MALFGLGAPAPGVIYNVYAFEWDPNVLVQHVLDSGYSWLAIEDAATTINPPDIGGFVAAANPRGHPEVKTIAQAAGLLFGVVGRNVVPSPNGIATWSNASLQDSVSFWGPDFLLHRGVDNYWPSGGWNGDLVNPATFAAANPGLPLCLYTGNVRANWAYAAVTGVYGQAAGPGIKTHLQSYQTAGWQVLAEPNGRTTSTGPDTSANSITAATALGWSSGDVGIAYYNTPGNYPGWGNPADQAATGGMWGASDIWPFNDYDFAWCMADGWFHGRLP